VQRRTAAGKYPSLRPWLGPSDTSVRKVPPRGTGRAAKVRLPRTARTIERPRKGKYPPWVPAHARQETQSPPYAGKRACSGGRARAVKTRRRRVYQPVAYPYDKRQNVSIRVYVRTFPGRGRVAASDRLPPGTRPGHPGWSGGGRRQGARARLTWGRAAVALNLSPPVPQSGHLAGTGCARKRLYQRNRRGTPHSRGAGNCAREFGGGST
jgi:hypothetical protein